MNLKPMDKNTLKFLKGLVEEWEKTPFGSKDRNILQRWLIKAIVFFCEFSRGEPQKVTWIETIQDFKELLHADTDQ